MRMVLTFTPAPAVGTVPFSPADMVKDFLIDKAKGWAKTKILSILGFGEKDPFADITKRLDEIEKTLKQINEQLTALNKEVVALQAQVAQSTYSTLHSNLNVTWVGSDQDAILSNLPYLVDEAQACAAGDRKRCAAPIPADTDPVAWCTVTTTVKTHTQAAACDTLKRIDVLVTSSDYANYQERLRRRPRR